MVFQRKIVIYQKKCLHFFSASCCWDALITLCGAGKNCPKNDSWKKQKTPPRNTSFLLAASPESPASNHRKLAGGWMTLGLPPSLLFMILEVRPELMTVCSLQSCCLHGGHSLGSFKLTSERGISHSCSREGEDSDQQLKKGCWNCQDKQLLNFHYKRLSSMFGILSIIEIDFHPKRSTLKSSPYGLGSTWAKPIYMSTKCCRGLGRSGLRFWLRS